MFKTHLVIKAVENGYELVDKFIYTDDDYYIIVPVHFFSDFASVPWIFRGMIARDEGGMRKASVIHDWLYNIKSTPFHPYITKKNADSIFLKIMLETDLSRFKAYSAYYAVKFFGNSHYKKG